MTNSDDENAVNNPHDILLFLTEEELEEEAESMPLTMQQQQQQQHTPSSLAFAPTTPRTAVFFIPALCLIAHLLFYYGQTAPMWRLHVHQNNISVWINATDLTSRTAMDTLGLPHTNLLQQQDEQHTIRTFTYAYGLHELWQARGMSGTFLPRVTALLLIAASGIWPHLKLILLNLAFLLPQKQQQQQDTTFFLRVLSTFGKWSLADVLTVCVMIAVMNLEWTIDPTAIHAGIVTHLSTLLALAKELWSSKHVCSQLLHLDCTDAKNPKHWTQCRSCQQLVHTAYTHPSWARTTGKAILQGIKTSGGGVMGMSVIGMRGIYAFCAAVVLSIVLSLVVEYLDARAKKRTTLLVEVDSTDDDDDDDNNSTQGSSSIDQPIAVYSLLQVQQWSWMYRLLPLLTLLSIAAGIGRCTMQRKAVGAIPMLLQDVLGFSLARSYSFVSLTRITGEAGGWDILLMSTFAVFIVVGPTVRALLCGLALAKVTPGRFRPLLASTIDFVGAFCAWEVLLVAIGMVGLLIPSITNTIVNKPECAVVSPDGSCFQIEFTMSYCWVVLGGVLLLVTSAMAVRLGRAYEWLEEDEDVTASTTMSDYYGVVYQRIVDEEEVVETASV